MDVMCCSERSTEMASGAIGGTTALTVAGSVGMMPTCHVDIYFLAYLTLLRQASIHEPLDFDHSASDVSVHAVSAHVSVTM